jgi:hypothetical protein
VKKVTEKYVQERLDHDRARKIANILAHGIQTRLKAQRRPRRRRTRGEATQPDAYSPETSQDTDSDNPDDGP